MEISRKIFLPHLYIEKVDIDFRKVDIGGKKVDIHSIRPIYRKKKTKFLKLPSSRPYIERSQKRKKKFLESSSLRLIYRRKGKLSREHI